jgi:hypothetical protein
MKRSEIRFPKPRNGKSEIEEPASKRTLVTDPGSGNIPGCMFFTETGTTNVPELERKSTEAVLRFIRPETERVDTVD